MSTTNKAKGGISTYIPPRPDSPVAVEIKDEMLWVQLKDGRVVGTPLEWYPYLLEATPAQRDHVVLEPFGVHWPDIDESLSIEGMLAGRQGSRWSRREEQAEYEMTVREVASDYNLTESAVYAAIRREMIPARKSGGTWLIRRQDAEGYWAKRRAASTEQFRYGSAS